MRNRDVYGEKVGTINGYNTAHEYLQIRKSLFIPQDLYVPLALVDSVDVEARDVHLAVTKDHLKRVCVVQPEDGSLPSTIAAPAN